MNWFTKLFKGSHKAEIRKNIRYGFLSKGADGSDKKQSENSESWGEDETPLVRCGDLVLYKSNKTTRYLYVKNVSRQSLELCSKDEWVKVLIDFGHPTYDIQKDYRLLNYCVKQKIKMIEPRI